MKQAHYHQDGQEFFIKENSWLARLAALKLRKSNMAITIGRTIHLWRADKEELLSNSRWLKHELCHVRQFRQYGRWLFLWKYLLESLRHGYTNNKYEREARDAERENG